jgi:hypothetical protein
MPANRWSREELISILGQPSHEWASLSRFEVWGDAQHIFADEVDAATEGAVRYMQWRCNSEPDDPEKRRQVRAEIRALIKQGVRVEPNRLFDHMGIDCWAASRAKTGELEMWVLVHVCSRHRPLGLVAEPGAVYNRDSV